jgi:3-hydroxy acid dehydrogenase / malonic semialdehyde reductase
MSKIVFITGATSGFGKAAAEKFASHGYDLILNGRREERLEEIKARLEGKFNIAVCLLPFDVRDRAKVFGAIENIPNEWQNIDILINNAGLALGRDYFDEANIEVYEKGNVYCASKFAVDAISQSMRIDLLRHGIKVTNIEPGAAETEFGIVRFKGDETTAKQVYNGIVPLSADDVAEIIYYTTTLPPHVCINELVVTCTQQASAIYFNRK